jgi:hypothetical protein
LSHAIERTDVHANYRLGLADITEPSLFLGCASLRACEHSLPHGLFGMLPVEMPLYDISGQ